MELSDNAKIEKEPVFKEMWTPIDLDMVIRDNYRLFFIEIKSHLRFENISRLITFREILKVNDKKNSKNCKRNTSKFNMDTAQFWRSSTPSYWNAWYRSSGR